MSASLIETVEGIRTKMCTADTFFDAYEETINIIIPELNIQVEEYVRNRIAEAKQKVITDTLSSINWEDMQVGLLTSVKNNRPVNERAMIWVDLHEISDNDLDAFDDSDIICMYDTYDENSVKIHIRHRKALQKYINDYIRDIKTFDATIDNWISRSTKIMIEENVKCLTEYHYNSVAEMMQLKQKMKQLEKQKEKQKKKSKKKPAETGVVQAPVQAPQQQQQPPEPKTIILNGVEITMIQSQREFIKNSVKKIVEAM